jgi:hypothetical protein
VSESGTPARLNHSYSSTHAAQARQAVCYSWEILVPTVQPHILGEIKFLKNILFFLAVLRMNSGPYPGALPLELLCQLTLRLLRSHEKAVFSYVPWIKNK